MLLRSFFYLATRILLCSFVLALAPASHAQSALLGDDAASSSLPDAPQAQQPATPTPAVQPTDPSVLQQPAPNGPLVPQASTSAQKQRSADEVLRDEEKQRLLGVMPMFNVVNRAETIPPLRPGQKFQLFWRSSTDPFIFALDAFIAGVGQLDDSNAGSKLVTRPDGTTEKVRYGFPQGAKGYFMRFGATYADTFDGNFWGQCRASRAPEGRPALLPDGQRLLRAPLPLLSKHDGLVPAR